VRLTTNQLESVSQGIESHTRHQIDVAECSVKAMLAAATFAAARRHRVPHKAQSS